MPRGQLAVRLGMYLAIATAAGLAVPPGDGHTSLRAQAGVAEPPRLIVLVVVDQFRADYVSDYGMQWTQGLRRLFDEGAVFEEATVPYGVTRTCAGFASISTGTFPSSHGLIDNEWFDRGEQVYVPCTRDSGVTSVPFAGARGRELHGPQLFRTQTLAESLSRGARRPAKVVSLALKARASISLAGRVPNAIVAWEEDTGTWSTSSAYASSPPQAVDAFIRARPTSAALGEIWRPLLPRSAYRFDDAAPGEPASNVFPYALRAPLGAAFTARWDTSPWSDAYVGDLAATLVEQQRLGAEPGTDFLAVGFSALDYVGHLYGPRSHEVQDVLARLDVTLGRLLATLDRSVGRGRYLVALTSDHGVAPLPEQGDQTRTPGGRIRLAALAQAIETALMPILGRRQLLDAISTPYVYFAPGVADQVRSTPGAQAAVERAVRAVPGIDRIYWSTDLAATTATADPLLALMRRSYVAGRSGDLAFMAKPYWVAADVGTTHGTPHAYDVRVPLVFFGTGIRGARHRAAATIVDVAPTLAAFAGVSLPRPDGRPLADVWPRK